jgi:hypothetical protein
MASRVPRPICPWAHCHLIDVVDPDLVRHAFLDLGVDELSDLIKGRHMAQERLEPFRRLAQQVSARATISLNGIRVLTRGFIFWMALNAQQGGFRPV